MSRVARLVDWQHVSRGSPVRDILSLLYTSSTPAFRSVQYSTVQYITVQYSAVQYLSWRVQTTRNPWNRNR